MDGRIYPLFDDDDETDEFAASEVDGESQQVPYGYAFLLALPDTGVGTSADPFEALYRFMCEPEMVEPTWFESAAGLEAVESVLATVRADPALIPTRVNWAVPFGHPDFRGTVVGDLESFARALGAGQARGAMFYLRIEN